MIPCRMQRCVFLTLFVLVAAFWGMSREAVAQREVVLMPVKDNTIFEEDAGTSNGIGTYLFAGSTNQSFVRRALLAFDLAEVPDGAVLDSVLLTLHLSRTISGMHTVAVHRVLADWGEGTSDATENEGRGAAATPGDATWSHAFFETDAWQSEGGDFTAAAGASMLIAGDGSYTWRSPELQADVQAWLDGSAENFGWILLGDEQALMTAKRFDSRENPDTAVRPTLRVFFSVPTHTEAESLPEVVHLDANFPNPFGQATTIPYTIRAPALVVLEVFDLLGRKVSTLVQGWQGAGTHAVTFDAEGLPEGLYVYRLSAGRWQHQKKMVLLR